MDCLMFGTILYFMVGLAPSLVNYLIFMATSFSFSVLMNEYLFFFATVSRAKSMVQVVAACLLFVFILFSGFILAPNVIPSYYNWVYWYNPMAWAYRALLVNEYRSSFYTEEEGDYILTFVGFVDGKDQPFTISSSLTSSVSRKSPTKREPLSTKRKSSFEKLEMSSLVRCRPRPLGQESRRAIVERNSRRKL